MFNNINIDSNKKPVFIQSEESLAGGVQASNRVNNASNLSLSHLEDGLVEYNSLDLKEEKVDILMQEYSTKMNEYLEEQRKLMKLKEEYARVKSRISSTQDEDKKAKLEQKAQKINSKISASNSRLESYSNDLNDINAQIHAAICDMEEEENEAQMAKEASLQSQNGIEIAQGISVQNQNTAFNVQNVQYEGNTIPKGLAVKLDNRLGQGFSQKCEQVAAKIGCNTGDLLAMLYSESGLNTAARNKGSNAIGLAQFIPSTLNGNGYSTEQVAAMNGVQQLDVVADIFMKAKTMAGYRPDEKIDGGTLYAINWLPAYAKKDVITTKGGKYYSSGLDSNKDGAVTKGDLAQRLQNKYQEMLRAI